MRHGLRARLLVLLSVVLCGTAIWGMVVYRARATLASPAGMLARLPTQDAILLYADFDALRRTGILRVLARSKAAEEPEYQAFVRSTGFDYQEDLDSALVSFHADGEFFLVKGRFDWKKLQSYARDQGGSCFHALCRMEGSAPNRKISFFPLQSNVMALAVSADTLAATRLQEPPPHDRRQTGITSQPVWLSIPASALKNTENVPSGARLLAKALEQSERIVLSMGPQDRQFEARLEVTCRSAQEAAALVGQLERATSLLRDMMAKENRKPNPNDLGGVLTAGVFQQQDRRVLGRWLLTPGFLETLAGGRL